MGAMTCRVPRPPMRDGSQLMLDRAQQSDVMALKVRDVFQGRHAKRLRWRWTVILILSLILCVTAGYFALSLFLNMRPYISA